VLCKVMVGESFYLIRCCVRGVLLEVNERLIKAPGLLNTQVLKAPGLLNTQPTCAQR
jgi:glycine cleavage system H lipoate-binding protein